MDDFEVNNACDDASLGYVETVPDGAIFTLLAGIVALAVIVWCLT